MDRTTMSRKSFWVYYRDRHDAITRLVAPLREAGDEVMAQAAQEATPAAALRAALHGIGRTYAEHGRLLRALAEASRLDPEANRVWGEFTKPVADRVADHIRNGLAGVQSDVPDPATTARFLIRMNLAVFFDELVDEPRADLDDVVDALLEIWTRTLFRATPAEVDR